MEEKQQKAGNTTFEKMLLSRQKPSKQYYKYAERTKGNQRTIRN